MTLPNMNRNIATFGFVLVLLLALPTISFAQGRGNGRGAGPNLDKKCAKFVNCHDARDGRWDGRGPAVNPPVNNPTVTQFPPANNGDVFRHRRHRDRERDDEILTSGSRNRRSDREGTRNSRSYTWRHRRTKSD